MPLDGNTTDYSGNSNHGTPTAITYAQGKFGQCASFNGSTSVIKNSTNLGIDGGNITLMGWMTFDSPSTFSFPIQTQSATSRVEYSLKLESSTIKAVRNKIGTAENQTTGHPIRVGKWYHCATIYDGTNVNLYVDGQFRYSVASSGNGSATTQSVATIGCDVNTGTGANQFFFNGLIDEVIRESRAWSAKEVETYYKQSVLNYNSVVKRGGLLALATYVLSCATGAFTLTGNSTNLLYKRIMTMATGAFVLTGNDTIFKRGYILACAVGNYILTGFDVGLKKMGWNNETKSSSSWSNDTKSSTSFTNESKNSSSWTNTPKS
jgi:hypothetical protein